MSDQIQPRSQRPSLDMFPPPGKPSQPPTWDDIERLAVTYAPAHHAVTMVRCGDWTREQALIALVYWFAEQFSGAFKRELDRLNTTIPTHWVFPKQE